MSIKQLIGNYQEFFLDINSRLENIPINIEGMQLSHLNYRTTTNEEYENLRDKLKTFCKEFVETQFNGRAISILVLRRPLILSNDYSVEVIELPAPRLEHMYPSGLEHLGILIGETLPEFKERYARILTGEKDRRPYCFPAYITFENGKTAKFYERTLKEVVNMQGWTFKKL